MMTTIWTLLSFRFRTMRNFLFLHLPSLLLEVELLQEVHCAGMVFRPD